MDNSITAAACFTAGQNNQSQRWKWGGAAAAAGGGAFRTANGRCLSLTGNASVPSAPGRKITITDDCSADGTKWQLAASPDGNYTLKHPKSGLCATLDPNLEFVTAVPCGGNASLRQTWGADPHEGQLHNLAGLPKRWGEGRCLQAVEPNPKV